MPMPKRELTDHEKDAYSTLVQHMGNPMDEFDIAVGKRLEELAHEKNYAKMQAAQTGGASVPMGPSDIEQAQVKQRGAGRQQAAVEGAEKAAQAQAGQTGPNAPPAAAGPVGASQPYPAQSGPQPPANAQPSPGAQMGQQPPAAPGGDQPAPEGEAEAGQDQEG